MANGAQVTKRRLAGRYRAKGRSGDDQSRYVANNRWETGRIESAELAMAMSRAGLHWMHAARSIRSVGPNQGTRDREPQHYRLERTHWHVVQENLSFDLIIRDRERASMERISFVTEISVLVSKNVLFVTKEGGI